MKLKWLIAIGIVTLIVSAVGFTPATVVEGSINQRLGEQASLRVTSGTIWSGAGMFTWRGTNTRLSPLEIPLNWSFAPLALLQGRAAVDITASGRVLRGSARVGAGLSSIAVSSADLTTSLEVMGRFHANLAQLRASGDVNLKNDGGALTISHMNPRAINGNLKVRVEALRLRTISNEVFGNYTGSVAFAGQDIRYRILQSSGMLQLVGDGTVNMDTRQFRYKGIANPARGAPFWLPAALLAVGRPSLDGRFNIDYNTRF
jgi:Type II secretion system (T2SS), protein N